jgi:hypothetical protein
MIYKFGRQPKRLDPQNRTLRLGIYLPETLPPIPSNIDWTQKMGPLQMWGNDRYGCCVFAAMANLFQAWAMNTGRPLTLTEADVLAAYRTCAGFNPNASLVKGVEPADQGANTTDDGVNTTDNGVDILTALTFFVNTGIGGHKLGAFFAIDPGNIQEVRAGMYLGMGLICGLKLPLCAQTEFETNRAWTVDDSKGDTAVGSWEQHCVAGLADDADNMIKFATWAKWQSADGEFQDCYMDEAYALASVDQLNGQGQNPLGLDWDRINAVLAAVKRL